MPGGARWPARYGCSFWARTAALGKAHSGQLRDNATSELASRPRGPAGVLRSRERFVRGPVALRRAAPGRKPAATRRARAGTALRAVSPARRSGDRRSDGAPARRRGCSLELAMAISLTSLGSSQTFPFPQPRTEAASLFWNRRDTMIVPPSPHARSIQRGRAWPGRRAERRAGRRDTAALSGSSPAGAAVAEKAVAVPPGPQMGSLWSTRIRSASQVTGRSRLHRCTSLLRGGGQAALPRDRPAVPALS